MKIRSIAGVVYLCTVTGLCGEPLDDNIAAFESKANAALAEAPAAVNHARKASDLDGILDVLKALQSTHGGAPDVTPKLSSTVLFITQWQDYLSAAGAKNWPEAQSALRMILNNRQIETPSFFPRSEILARYEVALHDGAEPPIGSSEPVGTDPEPIFKKIQKVDDISDALMLLDELGAPPGGQPWDWSELVTLEKARADLVSGITVTVDLQKAMTMPDWGDTLSRIIAMELLAILPHYLGTAITSPPQDKETLTAYLERIADMADASGNLAMLQRVVAVQVALGTARDGGPSSGTQQFLAGLSLDAAGQYAPAVISYENALKNPDRFLPVKIVGARLAAIKAAHPDDFATGLNNFLTPPIDPRSLPGIQGIQLGMRPNLPWQNQVPTYMPAATVLPIPMTIAVPAQATPASASSGNASPSGPK